MEKWQKNFWEIIEQTAEELELFCQDIGYIVETITDELSNELAEVVDFIEEEVEALTTIDHEQFWTDLLEPRVKNNREEEIDIPEDRISSSEQFDNGEIFLFDEQLEPSQANYPACIGCQNYHGRSYGGNFLVCAIHPYGYDDQYCPDKRSPKDI